MSIFYYNECMPSRITFFAIRHEINNE